VLLAGLPPGGAPLAASALQRRAALASTLIAGLELTRDGEATLYQDQPFGEIQVGPGPGGPGAAAA
jgi:segregation and condensation protein A